MERRKFIEILLFAVISPTFIPADCLLQEPEKITPGPWKVSMIPGPVYISDEIWKYYTPEEIIGMIKRQTANLKRTIT